MLKTVGNIRVTAEIRAYPLLGKRVTQMSEESRVKSLLVERCTGAHHITVWQKELEAKLLDYLMAGVYLLPYCLIGRYMLYIRVASTSKSCEI